MRESPRIQPCDSLYSVLSFSFGKIIDPDLDLPVDDFPVTLIWGDGHRRDKGDVLCWGRCKPCYIVIHTGTPLFYLQPKIRLIMPKSADIMGFRPFVQLFFVYLRVLRDQELFRDCPFIIDDNLWLQFFHSDAE